MMRWFSISGIMDEVKKTRWPKKKDIFLNTMAVIGFSLFFIVFFMLFDLISVSVMKLLG